MIYVDIIVGKIIFQIETEQHYFRIALQALLFYHLNFLEGTIVPALVKVLARDAASNMKVYLSTMAAIT